MFDDILEITNQIRLLKEELATLWEINRRTDPQVLDLSIKIDELINKYYRLLTRKNSS